MRRASRAMHPTRRLKVSLNSFAVHRTAVNQLKPRNHFRRARLRRICRLSAARPLTRVPRSSNDKNLTVITKCTPRAAPFWQYGSWPRGGSARAEGLGESRAGKPANSPVGAISGGVGSKGPRRFLCRIEGESMSIERLHCGPRMSQVVIHNQTVYLAGQVAAHARGEERRRTDPRDTLRHRLLAAGSENRQEQAAFRHDLAHRHVDVRGNEQGLGTMGRAGIIAGPRDGRSLRSSRGRPTRSRSRSSPLAIDGG